jgi:flagellar export protein FliJ
VAVKPEYRLSTLLKIRERKKEAAEHYLAECMGKLRAEKDRLKQMEGELERMIAKRKAKAREYAEKTMRGEMSAQEAVGANVYIERLKEAEEAQKNAIEGQKAVVAQREEDVKGARADLVKAEQELKALEKHKEKWTEEVKKEEQQRQEEAQDEIAQRIFMDQEKH